MLYYQDTEEALITLGKDAGYYHPKAPNIAWNSDAQPYGYDGGKRLMNQIVQEAAR